MSQPPLEETRSNRLVSAGFGVLLLMIAAFVLTSADVATGIGSTLLAVVLGLLGVDALISAARKRRSLMSRIGPLP
jgi:uncharacterized membrane protein HdeD (DUF308 family)